MPGRHGKLGSDQRGFPPVAFFEDLKQVEALLIVETVSAPVIKDEQLNTGKLVDHAREAAVEACKGKILEQARHAQI